MSFSRVVATVLAFSLLGCSSRQPLNPPSLISARDTDIAIQLYMQATILLARYYGFNALEYEEIRDRSVRHGYEVIPFMAPISTRATPQFNPKSLPSMHPLEDNIGPFLKTLKNPSDLLRYYITTGLRASQLICRNYMIGLDEKNRYLDFLQTEFNIGAGLASAFFILANSNVTAMSILHGATVGTNLATDAYQEYRFLAIDRDVAVALIDTAQNKIASDFLNDKDFNTATFSDAVQIVSSIEYQCTRSGIRNLITNAAKEKTDKLGTPSPPAKQDKKNSDTPPKVAAAPKVGSAARSTNTGTTLQPK